MSRAQAQGGFSIRKMISHVVVVVVCAGVVFAGWYFLVGSHGGGHAASHEAHAGPPPEVGVLTVRGQPVVLTPDYLGQTEAAQVVEIRARVAGFLEEANFREGGPVERGQVLFRIDPQPFEAEVAVAEARLEAAQAQVRWAEDQVERFERLVAQGAATEPELEEQQTALRIAQAEVALARAQLRQAELDLGYTTVHAPIDGLIGQTLRDVGSYVDAGATGLLAVVSQVDPIHVNFTISELELLRVNRLAAEGRVVGFNAGQMRVRLVLSDGTTYPHEGMVDFVDVAVDPSTSTTLLRATVPNPDGFLRPGQFVHVVPLGYMRPDAIVVPQGAVQQTPTGSSVYVVDDEDVAMVRPVELGSWVGTGWVIEDGLREGDRVVVDGIMKVRPGLPVAPAPVLARAGGAETGDGAGGQGGVDEVGGAGGAGEMSGGAGAGGAE